MKRELALKSLIAVGLCAAALATARTPAGAPPAPAKAPARPAATATTTAAPAHTTGQPNQSCGSSTAPNTPGNAAQAPGSAFNPDGKAGTVYAGQQPQNSRNPVSVSQYDVACSHQR